MRQIGSLLVRLNLETRAYHAGADGQWLELARSGRPSRQAYMQCLVRAYGFESPLEAALRYTRGFDQLVDMTGRYRAGLIAQDLLQLGLGPAQVATIPQLMIAPFAHVAEALGWLYVHERATLVFDQVRRELLRHHPDLVNSSSFLSAYDGIVGQRFDDLGQQLDRLATMPAIASRVVLAAQDAFQQALAWNHAPEPAAVVAHR
jgi:heme oxygenase